MSRVLTVAYLAEQHVELLPARTVLSLFAAQGTNGSSNGDSPGTALVKMLGLTTGGQSSAGPDGSDGHPNQSD